MLLTASYSTNTHSLCYHGMSQFIYILENRSIDQAVRIIKTDKDVADLPKHLLYYPGVRPPFTVFMKYVVADAAEAECRIHEHLASYRSSSDPTLFGIDAWQAGPVLDALLSNLIDPATPSTQDTQHQDELLSAATQIAISMGKIWPSALAGPLSISFEEARGLIRSLQARGVINAGLDLCPDYRALHIRQEAEKSAELAAAKAQEEVIAQERRRREAAEPAGGCHLRLEGQPFSRLMVIYRRFPSVGPPPYLFLRVVQRWAERRNPTI